MFHVHWCMYMFLLRQEPKKRRLICVGTSEISTPTRNFALASGSERELSWGGPRAQGLGAHWRGPALGSERLDYFYDVQNLYSRVEASGKLNANANEI